MIARAFTLATAVCLASCTTYQVDTGDVAGLQRSGDAVILVKLGPVHLDDMPQTNVFGGSRQVASILIAPYWPPALPGGRIATYPELGIFPGQFPISNDWPGGFISKTIPAGDYVIKGLYRQQRWSCFNEGSVAFHAEAGQVLALGSLDANAYLRRIGQHADADAAIRAHTHTSGFGLLTLYSGNDALDRTEAGWSDPTPADTALAQAFMRTSFGNDTPVQPARFSAVSWHTEPQRNNIDSCGSTPAFTRTATYRVVSASPAGLVVASDVPPPAEPPSDLPGIALPARPDGTRTWTLDAVTTLTNGTCLAVPASVFLRDATAPGERHVAFTTYQTEDDAPWAAPQAHVYAAGTSDKPSCPYPSEAGGAPARGGVIFIPQFHHR